MEFETILKKFEFLFEDSNDVERDFLLVEGNLDIQEEKEKYVQITLKYLEDNICKMPPITLLTNLGLFSIGESLDLITYPRRINQFELDFMMALVLKYGVMKMGYDMNCGEDEIEKLLKAISIYIFCMDHELHKDNMDAYKLNTYYRTSRINGFDNEKVNIIKEFCYEYDKKIGDGKIKLSGVIQFITAIDKLLAKRLEGISGHEVCLENQYKFFMFTPEDIKEICEENCFNYLKVISLISKFCCKIGDLRTHRVEEIYLDNPINDKFVILVEPGIFFVPNINVIIENLFELFEKIIEYDNQEKTLYFDARTEYLEKKTASIISTKFANKGKLYLNSQWDDIRHGENDCTLLYEDYAIVFEDKSGRVNRNTHKGLLKSAYKDNKKLIEEASEQASLFANLLEKNLGKELTLKVKGGVYNVIDLKKTKHILKIGIVFEETILQNMTLGNKKHSPIVSIFQLNKIFQCLESEEIIDYFIKRNLIESNISYHGDEYDFLFTYLKSGLNTTEKIYIKADETEKILIPYTEKNLTREDLEREKWFQGVINFVIEKAEENWLDKVISLLNIPPSVQKQIIRDVFKIKELVLEDNIKVRNKVIVVKLLEYYDYDTQKEIEDDIENYKSFSEVLYIAFTENFEYIVVKLRQY